MKKSELSRTMSALAKRRHRINPASNAHYRRMAKLSLAARAKKGDKKK